MWIEPVCFRFGYSRTDEAATRQAGTRLLSPGGDCFKAAEAGTVLVFRYLGFRVAKVILQRRQIGQNALPGLIDEIPSGIPARE